MEDLKIEHLYRKYDAHDADSISLLDLVKVSRPGLWLVFIWLYLWPTGGYYKLLSTHKFWMGMIYCTFPLNLLVYGMNDIVDDDVDAPNSRKGNFIYGAKLSKKALEKLPLHMATMSISGFVPLLCADLSLWSYVSVWYICAVGVNYVYNNHPFRLSRKCPYELPTMIVGHLLIPHFACHINDLPYPPFASVVFHILLLSRSHIWLEYADIDVDKIAGKRTIAVMLGHKKALSLVLLLTALEAVSGFLLLGSNVLGVFSLFGMLVFYLSAAKHEKPKTDKMYVSVVQSLVGVVVMVYFWRERVFS